MSRWEPNAEQRLKLAALELYATRGYDSTTIGDIAAHAGVTSRTYFRYFPDKREVLFGGADELRNRIAHSLRDAPAGLAPLAATLYALGTCESLFDLREHEQLSRRDAVIAGSSDLQERESRKLASIAAAVADRLIERGSGQDDARLVADLALAVFKRAARLWMVDPVTPFSAQVHRAAADVRGILTPDARDP